jgi:hypothetical protein
MQHVGGGEPLEGAAQREALVQPVTVELAVGLQPATPRRPPVDRSRAAQSDVPAAGEGEPAQPVPAKPAASTAASCRWKSRRLMGMPGL